MIRVLVALAVGVLLAGPAIAQTVGADGEGDERVSIAREWALRGVVIADARDMVVLEHRSTGRAQLLRVGDVLPDGAAVVEIAADRVVVHSEGIAVTLRLGHAPVRRSPPPGMGRAARPSRMINRWRDR